MAGNGNSGRADLAGLRSLDAGRRVAPRLAANRSKVRPDVSARRPSARQLAELRRLALERRETFVWPASRAEAHAEIQRLRKSPSAAARSRKRKPRELPSWERAA